MDVAHSMGLPASSVVLAALYLTQYYPARPSKYQGIPGLSGDYPYLKEPEKGGNGKAG